MKYDATNIDSEADDKENKPVLTRKRKRKPSTWKNCAKKPRQGLHRQGIHKSQVERLSQEDV